MILDCLQSRKYCKAIMDDLLLFVPTKKLHITKLKDFLKNGMKISPEKCQLFRKELQYIGNTIFIKDRRFYVMPLRSRLEAIQKLKPPITVKGCRRFLCPEIQKFLKPLYDLTQKGGQFIWGEEQQQAFDKINRRLVKLPVQHLPDNKGRFHLY